MFCPRCGSPNPETTKFCRQCGLGLTQISSYIATGGTGQLTPPAAASTSSLAQLTAGYSPKQKMVLAILCLIFLPGMLAGMSSAIGLEDFFGPVAAVMMCVGIPWVVIHFRNQARLLEQQRWHMQMQMNPYPLGTPVSPVQPYLQAPPQPQLQVPIAQPIQQPYAPQPVYQAPPPVRPAHPPNTNPLGTAPGSVIEDDTRRLPGQ